MTAHESDRGSRWQLVRDVVKFQIKLGLEAVLDIVMIPASLAAAGLDLLFGNWRRPRHFHSMLRFGERCERWIDLWGVPDRGAKSSRPDADAVLHDIETLVRNPRTTPQAVRKLRRWAAAELAKGTEDDAIDSSGGHGGST